MTGEEKTIAIATVAAAFVVIVLIGGCTAVFVGDSKDRQTRICIQAGMEWRDGDCVRPEARQ